MAFKFVINNPKNGRSYQKEVDNKLVSALMGKKIDEEFDGGIIGFTGYKFVIRGGSDKTGVPMRKDIVGVGRKRVLLSDGTGYHSDGNGVKIRKLIRGNTLSNEMVQVNVSVSKAGPKTIEEILGIAPKEEPKAEAAKEEPKAESEKKEAKAEKKEHKAEKKA